MLQFLQQGEGGMPHNPHPVTLLDANKIEIELILGSRGCRCTRGVIEVSHSMSSCDPAQDLLWLILCGSLSQCILTGYTHTLSLSHYFLITIFCFLGHTQTCGRTLQFDSTVNGYISAKRGKN